MSDTEKAKKIVAKAYPQARLEKSDPIAGRVVYGIMDHAGGEWVAECAYATARLAWEAAAKSLSR